MSEIFKNNQPEDQTRAAIGLVAAFVLALLSPKVYESISGDSGFSIFRSDRSPFYLHVGEIAGKAWQEYPLRWSLEPEILADVKKQ